MLYVRTHTMDSAYRDLNWLVHTVFFKYLDLWLLLKILKISQPGLHITTWQQLTGWACALQFARVYTTPYPKCGSCHLSPHLHYHPLCSFHLCSYTASEGLEDLIYNYQSTSLFLCLGQLKWQWVNSNLILLEQSTLFFSFFRNIWHIHIFIFSCIFPLKYFIYSFAESYSFQLPTPWIFLDTPVYISVFLF